MEDILILEVLFKVILLGFRCVFNNSTFMCAGVAGFSSSSIGGQQLVKCLQWKPWKEGHCFGKYQGYVLFM